MAKNTSRGFYQVRNALYEAVNEVEIENCVQISQNDSKIKALAEEIVASTKAAPYSQYISELHFKVMQMKDAITAEIAAIKNTNILSSGYVLAINA
ncbi:MAG: hypothetical protein IJY85_09490 [Ruminococcus sp.]|nr:hypothetical protein [Ruminococcus sp.]